VDTLSELQASQQIVDKMKQRHKAKKRDLTKNFAKRSSKKVASTALAAATIGTVAVAVTMASLEVSAYCEEQKSLHDDENILYGTDAEFDLNSCIANGKNESKRLFDEVKNSTTQSVADAMKSTAVYSREKWNAIEQISREVFASTSAVTDNFWTSIDVWMHE